jgi:predicted Zn-dependent protease
MSLKAIADATISERLMTSAEKFEQSLDRNGLVVDAPQETEFLNELASRVTSTNGGSYRVIIVESPTANAFALPNGLIGINKGLLATLDNEAQLAMVVAHEISHIDLQHSLNQIEDIIDVSNVFVVLPVINSAILESVSNWYSRQDELEADINGFKLVINAGYDSKEALSAVNALEQFSFYWKSQYRRSGVSTHPKYDQRIEQLAATSPKDGLVGIDRYQKVFSSIRLEVFESALARRQFDWLIFRMEQLGIESSEQQPLWEFYKIEAMRQRNNFGDHSSAKDMIAKSLELWPFFGRTYYSAAMMAMAENKTAEARISFEKYLAANGIDKTSAEYTFAKFYYDQLNSVAQ